MPKQRCYNNSWCFLRQKIPVKVYKLFISLSVFFILLSFETSSVQQKRQKPESSCVSVKSDWSMDPPYGFKSGDTQSDLRYIISIKVMLIVFDILLNCY